MQGDRAARDRKRIDEVLADLGAQLEAAEAAELAAEVEDRTRREVALISVVDRLRASIGTSVTVGTANGVLTGELADSGPDWLRLRTGRQRSTVIPLSAVTALAGIAANAVASASVGPVVSRIDLRHVLRGLVRDRERVRLSVAGGVSYAGVLNRCGADFVEVAGSVPDGGTAGRAWLVPLSAIVTVQRS
jgi:hypothetical protein